MKTTQSNELSADWTTLIVLPFTVLCMRDDLFHLDTARYLARLIITISCMLQGLDASFDRLFPSNMWIHISFLFNGFPITRGDSFSGSSSSGGRGAVNGIDVETKSLHWMFVSLLLVAFGAKVVVLTYSTMMPGDDLTFA
jgi:hypothetical protein